MFLKSLEIRGFKSFADKTELKFKNGITAVVGPNGSGKSNVSDAVRWVLGEQSVKTLRGGKMEDVIFAGTQYRKPVGLAQVSLTLDNADNELLSDYSQVTVTRRIFRSGESEYLLNNTQCRLKDITSLFMDTGIGKEGYSLIGQGKIDAILSGKPEERRNLLEEAAGIVKFKSRKLEAEKKLDNTEQNLLRINDIISTFEDRIEPLRIENEKAAQFLELSQELKDKEISLIIYYLNGIDENINAQKQVIYRLSNDNIENINTYEEKSNKLSNLNKSLEDIENSYNNERNIYYENKDKINKLNSEIELLTERTRNLKESIKNNDITKGNLKGILDNLRCSKDSIKEELGKKNEEKYSLEEKLDMLEKRIISLSKGINEKERLLVDSRDEEFDMLKKISEANNHKIILTNQIKSFNDNRENLINTCDNYENSLKINITTKNMILEKLQDIREDISELDNDFNNNRKELAKIININSKDEQRARFLGVEINKTEAAHNMLVSLEKQYEGYNRSVKSVMENVEKGKVNIYKEQCSILGEVIQVNDGFETAIEIALGGSISNIITENEEVAKVLINHMKETKIGRATFLPITTIRGKKIVVADNIKNQKGYLGIAADLITFNKKYENPINYALGRILVCEDMDSALRVAKISGYNYKIVTQGGEIINPGGALTGGSTYQKNLGIITRKVEIEKLSSKIKTLLSDKNILDKDIEFRKIEIKRLDETNLNIKDGIHFKNIELTKLEAEVSNLDKDSIKLNSNMKILKKDLELTEEKIIRLKNELVENGEHVILISKKQQDNKENILKLELEIKDSSEGLKDKKEELTELKIKKAQLDEYILNKKNEFIRIEKEMEDNNLKLKEFENFLEIGLNDVKINEDKVIVNKEAILSIKQNIDELELKAKEYEIMKVKIKDDIKIISAALESLRLEKSKKEEEIHKNEIILTKLSGEKEGYFSRLNDEFSLSFAEACEKKSEIPDILAHKSKIQKLKNEIFKLGTVNVSAIEEYKDVLEKYNFMSVQKEDLEKAREEILSVIQDMTKKMKEVFKENFKILNQYFNETFKELFKGGSAELILSEGDELTSNIDINVEPPGKKVQNINLMSGGEKVLSAIALLFAILRMKPTPFCILDEIEAALDDANVYRYAEFLKEFSGDVQFIVITHRKGTMEVADVMYGITMEEKGVSKVVSVNLSDTSLISP